jgi:hypothetical protein
MSQVQTNLATGYLASFERPLAVSVMAKAQSWPFQQQLGFAAMLQYLKTTFHGLLDFQVQMASYSSSNAILTAAWNLIKTTVPPNPQVSTLMYIDPTLGPVGLQFQQLQNFGQVFALSPTELQQPATVASKVSALS